MAFRILGPLGLLLSLSCMALLIYIIVGPVLYQKSYLSALMINVQERSATGESISSRDERHYRRFAKPMITEMSSTQYDRCYGETPLNLVEIDSLAKASVIIAFHDHEKLSLILHTLHSIFQRTPRRLLKEIILIDDNTRKDDLQSVLSNYIKSVFDPGVVRLYRSNESLGLIRARNLGAKLAKGDVIVCMDSHMEVQPQWLERLLHEIRLDRKTLATSFLDWIEYNSTEKRWKYRIGSRRFITYFEWDLQFGFDFLDPEQAKQNARDPTTAIRSPVTVGTIWAMDRDFYFAIGGFDEKMNKWGGENLELPIQVWLNGGRVVNVPCSVAAHYEEQHYTDYRNTWQPDIKRNYKRLAQVWFGEYKEYVYYADSEIEDAKVGDVSKRVSLTHKTIHDIRWFFNTIYPQLTVPHRDAFSWGWVRNTGAKVCLNFERYGPASMYHCLRTGYRNRQYFQWNKNGDLRFGLVVVGLVREENDYILEQYSSIEGTHSPEDTKWIHWKGGPIMHWKTKQCLAAATDGYTLLMANCDLNSPYQQWEFLHYTAHYDELNRPVSHPETQTKTQQHMRDIIHLLKSDNPAKVRQYLNYFAS